MPVEEWGGISYALSWLDAALSDEWEIVPLVKVGEDLAVRATQFLGTLEKVADDVGVIGFGDNEAGICLQPTLSTIRPPRAEIGRLAAEMVLRRIEGQQPRIELLEAELISRESTARSAPKTRRKRR